MSYDPNSPVIQNAYVSYCDPGSTSSTGALVGTVRVLTLEVWKDANAPATTVGVLMKDKLDAGIPFRGLAAVSTDMIPTTGTLVLDFKGAQLVLDSITLTTSVGVYAKVLYTVDDPGSI